MNRSDADHPDVVVGELTLFNGQRQSDAAHMALLTPPRRAHGDRRSETLLIFLDLGGGGASGLARAMLEHFDRIYWRSSGPVTTALRHAVNAANAHLREENRLMPVSQRRRGGLICAVLRGDYVYLSQIGPGRALLTRDGRVMQYPARPDDRLPMGVSSGIEIHFSHSEIRGGDRLLLTGENWMGGVADNAMTQALEAEDVSDVLLVLEHEAGNRSLSVLVVECCPIKISPEPAPWESPLVEPDKPEVLPQEPLAPVAEPIQSIEAVAEAQESESVSHFDPPAEISPGMAYLDVTDEPSEPEGNWLPSRPLVGFSIDRERWNRSRQGLRRASSTFAASARGALKRVLPEPDFTLTRPQRHAKDSSVDNLPLMAGVAVAIPVLIAFVVVTFYLQRGEVERRATVVNQAHQSFGALDLMEGEDTSELLETALQDVEAALLIEPDDEELLAMRGHIVNQLDELETVIRPLLNPLWEYGPGQNRKLAATRMQVYVLDTDQGRVYQHTLDPSGQVVEGEEPTPVADAGQNVGDAAVGNLKDVVWMRASGPWTSDALLLLTQDNRLLQHSLSWGLSWVPFDAQVIQGDVRTLTPYDGRVYALDAQQDQIWRFLYNGDGFDVAEEFFNVPVPDLSGAVDMAIDGAIYILLEDGQIYKFVGGGPEPYQIDGLPQPLSRPVALVSEGDMFSGTLYIADAGAQSIIVLSKDGKFLHQIKANRDALSGLEDLAFEEDSRTLFVLANGHLYSLEVPPTPEPTSIQE